jgi:hypothetical protein
MVYLEVLQEYFVDEVACRIMRFLAHPTADLLRGHIREWHYWRRLSVQQLLEFNHYYHNNMTMRNAMYEQTMMSASEFRTWREEHMTWVPWAVRHPEGCTCAVHRLIYTIDNPWRRVHDHEATVVMEYDIPEVSDIEESDMDE